MVPRDPRGSSPSGAAGTPRKGTKAFLAAATLWLAAGASPAGETAETADPKTADPRVQVLTRRSEVVAGPISEREIRVTTRYGVLTVPLGDVLRVEFAPTPSGAQRTEILELLGALREEATRASARDRIIAMGEPALQFLSGPGRPPEAEDDGPAVGEILKELRDRVGKKVVGEDTVVARKFNIVGKVELDLLEVRSAYGTLRLERSDIERLVLSGGIGRQPVDRILICKTWTDPNEEFVRTREIISKRTKLKISEFTGTTSGDLKQALSKHRVLVLPEFEQGGNGPAEVAGQTVSALRKFVEGGGVIICCGGGSNVQFLVSGKLLQCSGGSSDDQDGTIQKRHPILKGVSGTVPRANATFPISVTAGPKMRPLVGGASGSIVVGVAAIGEGAVVYCGWDYFQSEEPHQRILANACQWAAGQEGFSGDGLGG